MNWEPFVLWPIIIASILYVGTLLFKRVLRYLHILKKPSVEDVGCVDVGMCEGCGQKKTCSSHIGSEEKKDEA